MQDDKGIERKSSLVGAQVDDVASNKLQKLARSGGRCTGIWSAEQ